MGAGRIRLRRTTKPPTPLHITWPPRHRIHAMCHHATHHVCVWHAYIYIVCVPPMSHNVDCTTHCNRGRPWHAYVMALYIDPLCYAIVTVTGTTTPARYIFLYVVSITLNYFLFDSTLCSCNFSVRCFRVDSMPRKHPYSKTPKTTLQQCNLKVTPSTLAHRVTSMLRYCNH